MSLSDNFETARSFARDAAQNAVEKAKGLASIAKANLSIYAEEDKVKKAQLELGKLYYRDYAVGEEMDAAEYLPWCQKIDESKKLIAELKDAIAATREAAAEKSAAVSADVDQIVEEVKKTADELSQKVEETVQQIEIVVNDAPEAPAEPETPAEPEAPAEPEEPKDAE